MNERELHQLRNAVNVIVVGLPLLRRQLGDALPSEVTDTLRALELAVDRCREITVKQSPDMAKKDA